MTTADTPTRMAAAGMSDQDPAAPADAPVAAAAGRQPTVHEAIAAVMREIGAISKDRVNDKQRFTFRGVDDVMNAIAGPFRKHGVYVVPEILEITAEARQTKAGDAMNGTRLRAAFHFYGPAGDRVTAITAGEGADTADKSTNKAMAAAFKYALLYTLMIPTEATLDDSDASHPEGEMLTPGGVRALIADEAKRLGMTREDVSNDYAALNGGQFIGDERDVSRLQAYLAALKRRAVEAEPPAEAKPSAKTTGRDWSREGVRDLIDDTADMSPDERLRWINDLLVEAVQTGAPQMARAMLQNALQDAAEAQRRAKSRRGAEDDAA